MSAIRQGYETAPVRRSWTRGRLGRVMACASLALFAVEAIASEAWVADAVTGCAIWSADPAQPGDGVSWTGACADGRAMGNGVLVWWDASGLKGRYVGDMASGRVHGAGWIAIRNDETGGFDTFMGMFAEGAAARTGLMVNAAGDRLLGEVSEGGDLGRGVVLTADGILARGTFRKGQGVGPLAVHYANPDGESYVGYAEGGERHGYGVFRSTEGELFAGRFASGDLDGPGVLEARDGSIFAGFYQGGVANGFGTWVDPQGAVVQGRFVDGSPTGALLVTLPGGEPTLTTWDMESKK